MIRTVCGITSANMQGFQNRRRLFQDKWRARDVGRPMEQQEDRKEADTIINAPTRVNRIDASCRMAPLEDMSNWSTSALSVAPASRGLLLRCTPMQKYAGSGNQRECVTFSNSC